MKDVSGSANDDCFWLADIWMPNGSRERLDSDILPAGWTRLGSANWTGGIDPVHAHGTTRFAWRSGAIADGQYSALISPLTTVSSTQTNLSFRSWVSSANGDRARIELYDSLWQFRGSDVIGEGTVDNRTNEVDYPAYLTTVLAVGASSDFDYRSHYSQYGSSLDFVASSGGGYGAIMTTDRTGTAGYNASGDYYTNFSGTSASAPLAAGIAALVLSKDGNLTRANVASRLNENCEKVGPVAYSGTPPLTRNDHYGYGRLNARLALNAATADTTAPTFNSATTIHYRAVDVRFSEPMGEGAADAAMYQFSNAPGGSLGAIPNRVIRILPDVYRLVWTGGDMATSGDNTVTLLSGIRDVAGNAVTGTLSRTCPGTKRIIALNCGNNYDSQGVGLQYVPPFDPDNDFQGNEWMADYLYGTNPSTYTTS